MCNRLFSLLFSLAFVFAFASCSEHKESVFVDQDGLLTLSHPDVPSGLSDSLEETNFKVSHYWDYMDFTIDSLTSSRDFMERTIQGYLDLFPQADSSVIRQSVFDVLARAQADTMAYSFFMNVPEEYLITQNPSRQEYYAYFADAFIASDFLSDVDKEVPRFYRGVVLMNRVGSEATDIPYETLQGDSARLSALKGVPTVLYLYNTGCSMCYSEAEYLDQSDRLAALIRDGKIQVLAISKTGPRERWQETTSQLPESWIHGSAINELMDLNLYAVFHVPTIYLIDASGKVVLKDVDFRDLVTWLEENELPADPRPIRVN